MSPVAFEPPCGARGNQYLIQQPLSFLYAPMQIMSRFLNETAQTTLLPVKSQRNTNITKAQQAEQVAVSAQGKRSITNRRGLCTLTDVEEVIGSLVSSTPGAGYFPLLPHTKAELYYRVGTSPGHVNMLKQSAVLATTCAPTEENWRRFLGQQLILLTELMTFCVPAFFTDNAATISPLGKRKARGAVRSDLSLNTKMFVPSRAKIDTAVVRSLALQYARLARVCDVQYGSQSIANFVGMTGITLPAEHDIKTVLMLKEATLTPTGSLLSFCTDLIMQVQCAAVLERLPSICSLLVSTTQSEMERFKQSSTCVVDETPSVSIAQLLSGAEMSAATAPAATVEFVRRASQQGDTLLPLYGLPRLARCMFKANEEIAATTMNGVNARFRALLNGFRVQRFPAAEPLYLVLDGLHRPYQVCFLNLYACLNDENNLTMLCDVTTPGSGAQSASSRHKHQYH
jgi:hypothetical protein